MRPFEDRGSAKTCRTIVWSGKPSARLGGWLTVTRAQTSTPRCRPLVSAASNAMPPAAGGCTFAAAPHAVTSVAATIRCTVTRHSTGNRPDTRSSDRSNRARTGSGTTKPATTTTVPNLRRRHAIPRTRQSPAPVVACREIGPICCAAGMIDSKVATEDDSYWSATIFAICSPTAARMSASSRSCNPNATRRVGPSRAQPI